MTAHYDPSRTPSKQAEAISLLFADTVARPLGETGSPGLYRNGLKRAFDVTLVFLSAPVSLVTILLLGLLVALQGGQPFYTQERVGRDGRIFRMWKLRTMVPDADRLLEAHLVADPAAREEWDRSQKLRDDPRITRFGRFLRRTSLDELPQLWNVFLGDMSLVGPRPMMPCQQGIYPGSAYYRLRPGITGPWQVSARNETEFAERAHYDTLYLGSQSFGNDLRLLFATIRIVFRSTGW